MEEGIAANQYIGLIEGACINRVQFKSFCLAALKLV
jgi:hypothetical protein